jgi:acid phosphatase (class A)
MRYRASSFVALITISLASSTIASAALAADTYYISPAEIDLVHILAPPPIPDSPAGKTDLQGVLAAVSARTDASIKQAQDDDQRTVFRFTDVMGPNFKTENLPLTTALFQHVYQDGNAATLAAKNFFKRTRPFVVDPEIKIIVVQPPDFSYPSNHSTFGNESGILLAEMVPENAVAIFARAAEYAHNRVVAGVHFPSDVEAGRKAASVIANTRSVWPHPAISRGNPADPDRKSGLEAGTANAENFFYSLEYFAQDTGRRAHLYLRLQFNNALVSGNNAPRQNTRHFKEGRRILSEESCIRNMKLRICQCANVCGMRHIQKRRELAEHRASLVDSGNLD